MYESTENITQTIGGIMRNAGCCTALKGKWRLGGTTGAERIIQAHCVKAMK